MLPTPIHITNGDCTLSEPYRADFRTEFGYSKSRVSCIESPTRPFRHTPVSSAARRATVDWNASDDPCLRLETRNAIRTASS
ncbi:hypothetical protein DF3PA_130035 [Candidatus Defluviicoccus seviourii]|uniref:Uncharacterized protein n=1 Tax=Candidatus Defluviicoccus seviourii TaxID=2565273 RepID=A0A564WAK9_9PROT|nr:hypothetical protein DF3PA_130035 [Candidatus Defluviicoccus seviourii]